MRSLGLRPELLVGLLLVILQGAPAPAQSLSAAPIELVRETVRNEINSSDAKFMFREREETGRGSETKLIVETREMAAGMLVAINDKPLTVEERQKEQARLDELVNHPQELRKKLKADKEDTEHTNRIMKALPEAFLYSLDGVQSGTKEMGNPGDDLVRLKFHPNPDYDPPSHTEQVLTGMAGYMLIDKLQHRIALIDGTLEKDVGFGWGILGRLDKGGRFVVQQGTMGTGVWQVTRMNLDLTGRILLFKKLVIKSTQTFSDFHEAPPNLTFAQGVELLKKQAQELAENRPQAAADQNQR
ncbi:MAG: hypothetical protein WBX03_14860 [Terriglobales bacterium]|jgi:hypothetical protein